MGMTRGQKDLSKFYREVKGGERPVRLRKSDMKGDGGGPWLEKKRQKSRKQNRKSHGCGKSGRLQAAEDNTHWEDPIEGEKNSGQKEFELGKNGSLEWSRKSGGD